MRTIQVISAEITILNIDINSEKNFVLYFRTAKRTSLILITFFYFIEIFLMKFMNSFKRGKRSIFTSLCIC